MGIGSKIKKGFKSIGKATGFDNLKNTTLNLATGNVYGLVKGAKHTLEKNDPMRLTRAALTMGLSELKDPVVKGYHDLEGHTAKARADVKNAGVIDAQKTLAKANADVDRDAADIVLGETSDTAGESLTDLRKKKTTTTSTQLGIV